MSELGPEDEALLRGARAGIDPTPDDQARVKRRLFAQLGIGAAIGGSAIATSTGASAAAGAAPTVVAGTATLTKLVIGVLFIGVVSGGALVMKSSHSHSETSSNTTATTVTTASSQSNVEPTPAASSILPVIAPLEASQAPVFPTPPLAKTPEQPTSSHSSSNGSAVSARNDDRSASTGASNAAQLPSDTPATAINSVQPASVASSGVAGPTTVDAESALLRSADTELKAERPDRALSLLDQHAAQFPNGVLTEEREAERVIVLCALGRKQEAHDAAAAFLTARPRSPQAARIRASCGGN